MLFLITCNSFSTCFVLFCRPMFFFFYLFFPFAISLFSCASFFFWVLWLLVVGCWLLIIEKTHNLWCVFVHVFMERRGEGGGSGWQSRCSLYVGVSHFVNKLIHNHIPRTNKKIEPIINVGLNKDEVLNCIISALYSQHS